MLWLKHDLPPEVLTHVCKVPFAIERFHGSPKLGCGHFQGAVIPSATRGLGHGQLRDGILSARQGLGCGHLWGRVLPTTMTFLIPLRFMALYCHLQFLGQTFLQGTGPGSGGRLRVHAPSWKTLSTRFPLREVQMEDRALWDDTGQGLKRSHGTGGGTGRRSIDGVTLE